MGSSGEAPLVNSSKGKVVVMGRCRPDMETTQSMGACWPRMETAMVVSSCWPVMETRAHAVWVLDSHGDMGACWVGAGQQWRHGRVLGACRTAMET